MKLEIGGQRSLPGWLNLGQRDTNFNIITQEIPFDDNSLEEFYWSHVIEHIAPVYIKAVVTQIYNKLKVGGKMRTVCPDLRAMAEAYISNDLDAFDRTKEPHRNHWGSFFGTYKELGIGGAFVAQICYTQDTDGDENILISGDKKHLYGHLSHIGGYDFEMLKKLFTLVGFSKIERTEVEDMDPHKEGGQLCVNAYK